MTEINKSGEPIGRNANFEVLRNVAMLFIVIYHILYHGVHLKEAVIIPNPISISNFVLSQYILTIVSICVNLYVLITGYFLFDKSFKSVRFIKVWFLALFYGFIITTTVHYFCPEKASLVDVIHTLRPMVWGPYWFVRQYLGLLIAAPLLGFIAKSISKKQFKLLLLVFFILGTNFTYFVGSFPFGEALVFSRGFSLVWFIFLFFTGAYIRRFDVRFASIKQFLILSIIICLYVITRICLLYYLKGIDLHFENYDYNGFPFVLAVIFFCWFKNLHFKENFFTKMLVKIAPYTFAVYLIHDNTSIRSILYGWGGISPELLNSVSLLPRIMAFSVLVFFSCILIDRARAFMFSICKIDVIQNKLALIFDRWINNMVHKLD